MDGVKNKLKVAIIWSIFYPLVIAGLEATCPLIFEQARVACGENGGITEKQCLRDGCCWDTASTSQHLRCYTKECQDGFFGWGCRFKCQCKEGDSCDRYSGQCKSGCPDDRWGIGCLLDNDCTYNDDFGHDYMGKKSISVSGSTCRPWSAQKAYPDDQFADMSRLKAENYCRNPKPPDYRTWCYIEFRPQRKWDYCKLNKCECVAGRFGKNCEHECHCDDSLEACDMKTGTCISGCDFRWQGPACQECVPGWFGPNCERQCRCKDARETCDVKTGACASGCRAGYTGDGCQTDCADGRFGFNCEFECNCADDKEVCDKDDGFCNSGCAAGYSGPGCQLVCRCEDPREVCSALDGSCRSGCRRGWTGLACHIEMPRLSRAPQLEARTATSLSVKWHAWSRSFDFGDGDIEGYLLGYTADGKAEKKIPVQKRLAYDLVGLKKNTLYSIQVTPVHSLKFEGLPSPPLNVSTCTSPLRGPASVQLEESELSRRPQNRGRNVAAGDDEEEGEDEETEYSNILLTVTWRMPDQYTWGCDRITKYKVYSKGPLHTGYSLFQEVDISRVQIPEVDPYSNYSVGVTMVNDADLESGMSEVHYVGKSGPVSNLRVKPGLRSIDVVWDPPPQSNAPVERYIIHYTKMKIGNCVETSRNPLDEVDADLRQYHIANVPAYTQYKVTVWARTIAGDGRKATLVDTTSPLAPSGLVRNLRVTAREATSASFAWDAPACEERNGEYGGFKYIVTKDNHAASRIVIVETTINRTDVKVDELIPYTKYTISVAFVNHVGEGPFTSFVFVTLEDRPPSPQNVLVESRTSHSLTIVWSPPDPPHGILISYELKFWHAASANSPAAVNLAPSDARHTLADLQPNTTYAIQVRAKTNAGAGMWCPVIQGFTEETYPSEPQFLTNLTRGSSFLNLSWKNPVKIGGVLQNFKVVCKASSILGRFIHQPVERELPADVYEFVIEPLAPGTQYDCQVSARTRKGYGPAVSKAFWTVPKISVPPPSPKMDPTKSTDTTVTLYLVPDDASLAATNDAANSVYQIVVQILHPQSTLNTRTRRSAEPDTPCGLPRDRLLPYSEASAAGHDCYVAVEMEPPNREVEFVVGDNTTRGAFHNPPLKKGEKYNIFVGLVVTVDGVTTASYSRTEDPIVARVYSPPADGANAAVLAGAAVGAIAVVLIIIIVIIVILIRRKKNVKQNGDLMDGENLTAQAVQVEAFPNKMQAESRVDGGYSTSEDDDNEPKETDRLYPNPGGKDPETSKPIPVEDLWNYIKEKKATNALKLEEYEKLPHNLRCPCEVARREQNKNKNRYGNIVAYDHSRVILEPLPGDPHSDYINANYIDSYKKPNAWIAMQGPSKFTLNDIWRLAWQKNCHRIVMVTNLVEDGRHKCEQYWPETAESRMYGDIQVEKVEEEMFADFTIRVFTISKEKESKTVRQFHFTAWPDHGVPMYATSILAFRKKIRSFDDPTAGESIIHCSAGVGRTGTLIALDFLLDQAKVEGQVDAYRCVYNMRTKRVNMVQTPEQYVFVYDALIEALQSGDTSISCVEFHKVYPELLKVNPETGKIKLQEEYDLLTLLSPSIDLSGCKDALLPDNVEKNRDRNIIPLSNMSRPYLLTYVPGSSDYINAVFTDGYKQRDAFLLTQMPLPNTIADFWAMCFDHDVKTIIMMNPVDQHDESCAIYYPDDKKTASYAVFKVETSQCDTLHPDVTIRDLKLVNTKRSHEVRHIRQFQYHGWPSDAPLPKKMSSIITLLQMVEKWQQRSGNGPIAVHCMDGATRSGVYVAVSYLVERLKLEQEVDVFHSVKHTRVNRPQLIPTLEQYKFLYEMAGEYMDCFATYANFKLIPDS